MGAGNRCSECKKETTFSCALKMGEERKNDVCETCKKDLTDAGWSIVAVNRR